MWEKVCLAFWLRAPYNIGYHKGRKKTAMIVEISCFSPERIARSGQCFRMSLGADGTVTALAGADRVRIRPLGEGRFQMDCTPETFQGRWRAYFDLDTDYAAIQERAAESDAPLRRAVCASDGLRILRQDPWETLICFLISQRKRIPAIRACVEALCSRCGTRVGQGRYFAFPTPEELLKAGEKGLRACGVGYRAPYLIDAARRVQTGECDLTAMAALSDGELMERLLQIHGVGVKVASCVMLFGYHRLSVAPVDVWIQRVIDEEYGGVSPFAAYGEYAGVFQQYLFFSRIGTNETTLSL